MEEYYSLKITDVENTCIKAIKDSDFTTFEFYFNIFMMLEKKQKSKNNCLIKSYKLLYLLSQQQNKDFFFLLETINPEDLDNEYIKLAIEVERCVTEGSFNKLNKIKKNCKMKEFDIFLELLVEALKMELKSAISKSYREIPVDVANEMLRDTNIVIKNEAKEPEMVSMENIIKDCVYCAENYGKI